MADQEENVATSEHEDNEDVDNAENQENVAVQISTKEIEKLEEEKLKAKFPMAGRPVSGHSAFLQKRLANRQKYFDSGDYQMAKQKPAATNKSRQTPMTGLPGYATGDCIPTPESVPVRKTSIIQTSKFTPSQ